MKITAKTNENHAADKTCVNEVDGRGRRPGMYVPATEMARHVQTGGGMRVSRESVLRLRRSTEDLALIAAADVALDILDTAALEAAEVLNAASIDAEKEVSCD